MHVYITCIHTYNIRNIVLNVLLYCTGELCGEEHDKDEKEEYYLLWKECGLAEQLRDYNSQNTATESIITGEPQRVLQQMNCTVYISTYEHICTQKRYLCTCDISKPPAPDKLKLVNYICKICNTKIFLIAKFQ